MLLISRTLAVSQALMLTLNSAAPKNIEVMLTTFAVFHLEMSTLQHDVCLAVE